jgi:hypothetical protein
MTVSPRAFAILGVLIAAAALAPATAQSDSTAAVVSERDIKTVLTEIKAAWRDYAPCDRHKTCEAYFESFGVALSFNDGTIVPFAHMQRGLASGHDCILNARAALERGDRALAVQWVMASYQRDDAFRAWLGDHPDTVVAALQRCCDKR